MGAPNPPEYEILEQRHIGELPDGASEGVRSWSRPCRGRDGSLEAKIVKYWNLAAFRSVPQIEGA